MTKSKKNAPKPVVGRALGTKEFLALVKRKAGPMKSNRDITRAEKNRYAVNEGS